MATFRDHTIDACVWKDNARFYGAASEVINEIKSNSVLWYGLDQSGLNRSENHIIYDYCMDNHSFH